MADKITVDMRLFMAIMFIIGLLITIYAFKLTPEVDDCSDNSKNATRGLLIMGVAMICISATAFACGCVKASHPSHSIIFISLIFIISAITTILTSMIKIECAKTYQDVNTLLVMSIISSSLSGSYLSYNLYEYINDTKKSSPGIEMHERLNLKGG